MEATKLAKFQDMKSYNRGTNFFLITLIQYSLVLAFFCLFLSCPLWLPTLYSSLKLFFMESFSKMVATVFGPKCLFVVFNLIIVFLVGESRLSSTSSCSKPDIYEEYVVHRQSLKGLSSVEVIRKESVPRSPLVEEEKEIEKEEEKETEEEQEHQQENEQEQEKEKEQEQEEQQQEEEQEEEEEEEEEEEGKEEMEAVEEEEERGLPAEELNKRVEDFIARFNMQRRLEARMLVCCA